MAASPWLRLFDVVVPTRHGDFAHGVLHVQDTQLALIHIPVRQYQQYLYPILRLLLPSDQNSGKWPFINISITPIEASLVLPRVLANQVFSTEVFHNIPNGHSDADSQITITPDDYTLMCVSGSGDSASQRVIDLTTPLALARISIFFITTYFNDWILVPRRSQSAVIAALETRGFQLSEFTHDDTDPTQGANTSSYTHRPPTASSDGSNSQILAPGTPPPATLSELQVKTFETLRKSNITPTVDDTIRLVQCSGRDGPGGSESMLLGIIKCLLEGPKFLSLTLTESEAPSLLLETRFLPFFNAPRRPSFHDGEDGPAQSILLGAQSDVLIPIVLDLRTLPLESTGIVCGVAGRLVNGTKRGLENAVEMSYLSTARAGAVMVDEADLDRAEQVLGQEGAEVEGGFTPI